MYLRLKLRLNSAGYWTGVYMTSRDNLFQDKEGEIEFFDQYADGRQYNVFTEETNERIVKTCIEAAGMKAAGTIADLGCGSGVFTRILRKHGFKSIGLDISHALLVSACSLEPKVPFIAGDAEQLPFASESLDAVLLSGLVHHLPDPATCAAEVYRVLKPKGVFAAFDPNRRNPFMWLYRDWDSPFYSSVGVTKNERPILAEQVAQIFKSVGFSVSTRYLSDLAYTYVASSMARKILPIYNLVDSLIFKPKFMERFSAFVITAGVKN